MDLNFKGPDESLSSKGRASPSRLVSPDDASEVFGAPVSSSHSMPGKLQISYPLLMRGVFLNGSGTTGFTDAVAVEVDFSVVEGFVGTLLEGFMGGGVAGGLGVGLGFGVGLGLGGFALPPFGERELKLRRSRASPGSFSRRARSSWLIPIRLRKCLYFSRTLTLNWG
jgi:hypothetical protein